MGSSELVCEQHSAYLKQMFKYANMIKLVIFLFKMGFFAYIIIHAGLFFVFLQALF